jgi:pimeloyl-ACP methyl ester carboxylesterase
MNTGMAHGWLSSFYEALDILSLLADPARYGGDPADAFDVIMLSLPGYGFSDRPAHPGMTPWQISAHLSSSPAKAFEVTRPKGSLAPIFLV